MWLLKTSKASSAIIWCTIAVGWILSQNKSSSGLLQTSLNINPGLKLVKQELSISVIPNFIVINHQCKL